MKDLRDLKDLTIHDVQPITAKVPRRGQDGRCGIGRTPPAMRPASARGQKRVTPQPSKTKVGHRDPRSDLSTFQAFKLTRVLMVVQSHRFRITGTDRTGQLGNAELRFGQGLKHWRSMCDREGCLAERIFSKSSRRTVKLRRPERLEMKDLVQRGLEMRDL